MRVEDESRPRHVDPVLEGTANVAVNRDPRLVVEGRRRGRRVDERRRTPGQVAATVERALVDRFRIRRGIAVEGVTDVEDVTLAVEREGWVAARVVRTVDQVLDARNECSDLARIGSRCVVGAGVTVAAPCRAAVVRVVRTRVGVTQRAAGRGPHEAGPGAGDIVIRSSDNTIGIVRVDGNRSFILRRSCGVLIHQDVRGGNGDAVERA